MKPHPGLMVLLSVLLGPAAAMAARFNVKSYGAIGDGSANDTQALQATIDAAGEAGGGEVYFPDGTYRTVRLNLRSHLVVNLSPGAILQASPVAADWSECNLGTVLGARGVDHLTLEGGGTVDGAGFAFYDGAGQFTLGNRDVTGLNFKGKVIFHDDGHSGRPVLVTENVTVTGSLSQ
jgi:polygalacturonase